MVLMETPICQFGLKALDFSLPNVDGQQWDLAACRGENGLLVMFICNHCPYVKAIQKKIVRDSRELKQLGINSVAIMSNDPQDYPEDSFENMKRIADEMNYPFPYLFDESQDVAKRYGAVCTPDFFGYNAELELQYRGRLDSSGKNAPSDPVERELFEAMKGVAESGQGPAEQVVSIGCSIKWKNA